MFYIFIFIPPVVYEQPLKALPVNVDSTFMRQGSSCSNRILPVSATDFTLAHGDFGKFRPCSWTRKESVLLKKLLPNVKSLKVGDRVSVAWFFEGCGEQWRPAQLVIETLSYKCWIYCWWADGPEQYCRYTRYTVKVPWRIKISPSFFYYVCAGVTTPNYQKSWKLSRQWIVIYGAGGLGNGCSIC